VVLEIILSVFFVFLGFVGTVATTTQRILRHLLPAWLNSAIVMAVFVCLVVTKLGLLAFVVACKG